jgi:Na+-transporting NADH:ubiquinone oxidoreductase subunit NqrA
VGGGEVEVGRKKEEISWLRLDEKKNQNTRSFLSHILL